MAVDLVDLRSETTVDGYKWMLTMLEEYSGFVSAVALEGKHADKVAQSFMMVFCASHGLPRSVRSDQGSEFLAEFSDALKANGVQKITAAVDRPQSNGLIERMHRELKVVIKGLIQTRGLKSNEWNQVLA